MLAGTSIRSRWLPSVVSKLMSPWYVVVMVDIAASVIEI
jgi:hypothetical protein